MPYILISIAVSLVSCSGPASAWAAVCLHSCSGAWPRWPGWTIRDFGPVPEEYIVGIATRVLFSRDYGGSLRKGRFLKVL